jgi:hypothetical protein
MHDRHKILHHLGFGWERFGIQNKQFCSVLDAEMLEPRKPTRTSRSLCAITSVAISPRPTVSINDVNALRLKLASAKGKTAARPRFCPSYLLVK